MLFYEIYRIIGHDSAPIDLFSVLRMLYYFSGNQICFVSETFIKNV